MTLDTHPQNSMSAISQLLQARFGSNFKQSVMGTNTTDYNCHHDIWQGNICPGDICSYQQYLSCYWPDLDQTLNKVFWEHTQQITTVTTTFVQATFAHISNISAVSGPVLDQTLNKGSWEHIQQITFATLTFVQAKFVLGTFVHISNISAVTGPILIKL